MALVHPVSHDEDQYVAATSLAFRGLLPYRDYAYLQTPLQPIILAPLAWVFDGWLLLASRIANALFALLTMIFTYAASRRLGATRSSGLLGATLLGCCYPFLWGAGVARNDMLPAALLAGGLWMGSASAGRWRLLLSGFCFGCAASVKISYAVPAAAIVFASLFAPRPRALVDTAWLLAGELLGVVPTALLALAAPQPFLFDVIAFPLRAPLLWYRDIGSPARLGPLRFVDMLLFSALGPALVVAAKIGSAIRENAGQWLGDGDRRVLLAAAAGGLFSAALIRPFELQYLIPALPPLFIAFAVYSSGTWPLARSSQALLTLFAIAGLAVPCFWAAKAAVTGSSPPLALERDSHRLGQAIRSGGDRGPIATLYAAHVIDSGIDLDPRFAAGPELYRTHGMLSQQLAQNNHIAAQDENDLLERAPGVFVTIAPPRGDRVAVRKFALSDEILIRSATRLGYRAKSVVGSMTIWTRDRSKRAPAQRRG